MLVFSGYLVYNTQQIVGGGKARQIRPTEHVLGALVIYTDAINLFLHVLQVRSELVVSCTCA